MLTRSAAAVPAADPCLAAADAFVCVDDRQFGVRQLGVTESLGARRLGARRLGVTESLGARRLGARRLGVAESLGGTES